VGFSLEGLLVWAVLGAVAGVLLGRFVRGSGRLALDAVLGAIGAEVAALVLALVLRVGGSVDALIAVAAAVVGAGLFVLFLGQLVRRRPDPETPVAEAPIQTVSSPT
jgi:uncharacterized membrane protein YeaQ/YmgE (transglycosylase-associated protein family)